MLLRTAQAVQALDLMTARLQLALSLGKYHIIACSSTGAAAVGAVSGTSIPDVAAARPAREMDFKAVAAGLLIVPSPAVALRNCPVQTAPGGNQDRTLRSTP